MPDILSAYRRRSQERLAKLLEEINRPKFPKLLDKDGRILGSYPPRYAYRRHQ